MMEIVPVVKEAMIDEVFQNSNDLKSLSDEEKKNARKIFGMMLDQIVA